MPAFSSEGQHRGCICVMFVGKASLCMTDWPCSSTDHAVKTAKKLTRLVGATALNKLLECLFQMVKHSSFPMRHPQKFPHWKEMRKAGDKQKLQVCVPMLRTWHLTSVCRELPHQYRAKLLVLSRMAYLEHHVLLRQEGEAGLFPLRGTGGAGEPDLTFKVVILNNF